MITLKRINGIYIVRCCSLASETKLNTLAKAFSFLFTAHGPVPSRRVPVKHEPSEYRSIPLSTFIEEDYVPLTLANCALLIIFGALLLVLMQSGLHMVQHVIDVHPY